VPEVGAAPDTADLVAQADAAVQVAEAMAQLPPTQFDVLQLAYFDDLSQSEIASRLGVPLGTVKSRMRLAMNRMREVVADLTPEA
jgi:RNA polymerase sigma-70 factor (ECF subfamily)